MREKWMKQLMKLTYRCFWFDIHYTLFILSKFIRYVVKHHNYTCPVLKCVDRAFKYEHHKYGKKKHSPRKRSSTYDGILKMKTWLPGCMSKMSRRCDGIIYPTYTNTPFKIKTFRINHPESQFWVTGKQIPNKYTL